MDKRIVAIIATAVVQIVTVLINKKSSGKK